MDEVTQFFAFVLSVAVLIGFFMIISRVGAILAATRNLEHHMQEHTRYLSAISANIARQARKSEP